MRLVGVGCGDCAVETDAGRRLGLASAAGWSVASGEVVRGLVSPSRTEVVRGVGWGMSDGCTLKVSRTHLPRAREDATMPALAVVCDVWMTE